MDPARRHLLIALGTGSAAALAGCIGRGSDTETTGESAKLLPAEGDAMDLFGESVALSADGGVAVVGADQGHPSDEEPGAAYIFERTDGEWRETATLTDENGEPGDDFGGSVALSADGRTALVGADNDTLASGNVAGSATVFEREDGWSQRATFTPDDGENQSEFGVSMPVSLSADGQTALLGAPAEADPNGEEAGAAYVYRRQDGTWDQPEKVFPEDGAPFDDFGAAVSLAADGTTAVVAAPEAGPPNGEPGIAYVFNADGGEWPQRARLRPPTGQDEQGFAASVAVSADGTTVLVGAWTAGESLLSFGSGWVYVFERENGGWTNTDRLVPSDGEAGSDTDWFGETVALADDGATAVVGAPNDHALGGGAGSAYVFERDGDGWTQRAKLAASDGGTADELGRSVAVSGDGSTALAGAHDDGNENGDQAGAAYVFEAW
jgi:hypothetical protein